MYGPKECYAPIRENATQVIISYDKVADGKKNAYWHEVYFNKNRNAKPSLDQIKEAVLADINQRVKAKIIGGFVWTGINVCLSTENQMNFVQAIAPVTLKIGENEEGEAVYQQFDTQEELKAFADACILWRQQCLQEGWQKKDSIDWSPYEKALEEQSK